MTMIAFLGKKLVLSCFSLLVLVLCNCASGVYICTGSYSERYHKSSHCRGLSHCSGDIENVSVEDARNLGRTPCEICY